MNDCWVLHKHRPPSVGQAELERRVEAEARAMAARGEYPGATAVARRIGGVGHRRVRDVLLRLIEDGRLDVSGCRMRQHSDCGGAATLRARGAARRARHLAAALAACERLIARGVRPTGRRVLDEMGPGYGAMSDQWASILRLELIRAGRLAIPEALGRPAAGDARGEDDAMAIARNAAEVLTEARGGCPPDDGADVPPAPEERERARAEEGRRRLRRLVRAHDARMRRIHVLARGYVPEQMGGVE